MVFSIRTENSDLNKKRTDKDNQLDSLREAFGFEDSKEFVHEADIPGNINAVHNGNALHSTKASQKINI